jgi:hypothetical protein
MIKRLASYQAANLFLRNIINVPAEINEQKSLFLPQQIGIEESQKVIFLLF